MIGTELQKVPEQRYTRYLWQVLDFWSICSVEVSDNEKDNRNCGNSNGIERHKQGLGKEPSMREQMT